MTYQPWERTPPMGLPDVTLRPFERRDASVLAAWLSSREALGQTAPDWRYPLQVSDIWRDYFSHDTGAEVLKGISDGVMVGHLGLRVLHGTTGHLFHVVVAPDQRRQGYGRAMLEAVSRLAFVERGLHRLQLYVFEDNTAAIACYLRAGYRVEGRHRDHFRFGPRWLSTYSMALLQSEWEPSI